MVKRCGPPSQGWRSFLRNHAPDIAAMDLFVVPTIGFDLLYVLVIVRLARRELVWINVTANPTAEWVARQITEAWNFRMKYRAQCAAILLSLASIAIRARKWAGSMRAWAKGGEPADVPHVAPDTRRDAAPRDVFAFHEGKVRAPAAP
jgi:hypothetical protein